MNNLSIEALKQKMQEDFEMYDEKTDHCEEDPAKYIYLGRTSYIYELLHYIKELESKHPCQCLAGKMPVYNPECKALTHCWQIK